MRLTRLAAGTAAAATVAGLAAGCGTQPRSHSNGPPVIRGVASMEPAVSPKSYAAADMEFGLRLLNAWCAEDPTSNLVLSPESLASGLGMAYLGARGNTAKAMAAVLHLLPPAGQPGQRLEAGLQARSRALRALDGHGVTVDVADQVWADPKLLPLHSYLNAVATGYNAGIGRIPLLTDPVKSAAEIDASVAAATGGHIKQLLTSDALSNVIFVLTDAMYLKAPWASPFDRSSDTSGSFMTAAGAHVQARYLNGGNYVSATSHGWTAVSLPYRGDKLTMTALLPPASASPGACPDLSATQLESLTKHLAKPQDPNAVVKLPKVNLRDHEELMSLLTQLGMGIAFSPAAADFSALSPDAAYIGSVAHAATLQVDDWGTIGSAATAVTILPTSLQLGVRTVDFNRPYFMVVSATATGEPLFLARVANPDQP